MGGAETFVYRLPASYLLVRGLLWIFAIAVGAVIIFSVLAGVRRPWQSGWRGYYTALAVVDVACAAWLLYWRVWTAG